MDKTPKLNLNVPRGNDYVDIEVLGQNFEIIDEKLGENIERTNENLNQINTLSDRVTTIENELSDQQELTTTLKYGSQVIEVPRDTPFSVLSLKGRTLVNLLGKDGNCEDTSKWLTSQASIALDTSNVMYGNNSIKITYNNAGATAYKNILPLLTVGKFYLALVDVKNGNATSARLVINFVNDAGWKVGTTITSTTSFQVAYYKIEPSQFDTATFVNLGVEVVGTSGQYAYMDGFRLYEIDQATYNKIDVDPEYTGDKLAEKFSYVDSVQAIQNPYVISKGKNLAKGYPYPYMDGNGISTYDNVWENGKLAVRNGSNNVHGRGLEVKVVPNRSYTFSFKFQKSALGTLGWVLIGYSGTTGEILSRNNLESGNHVFTFMPIKDTIFIKFIRHGPTSQNDPVYFWDMQLELGSIATSYDSYKENYLFLETKLHSSADGTVYDELIPTKTGFEKFSKIKEIVLDGSFAWEMSSGSLSGFKEVRISEGTLYGSNRVYASATGIKYDGKIMYNAISAASDTMHIGNTHFYLRIPNTDSGWGDNYTPTTDEIKAYFLGWKMFVWNGATNVPYNGTGTKAWGKIYCGVGGNDNGVVSGSATQTLPTTMNDQGYVPYRLIYQLATPVRETVRYEGSISLKEGKNIVELGSGVIIRERANPVISSGIDAHINNTVQAGSTLKNRLSKLIDIYKNGNVDTSRWKSVSDQYAYGTYRFGNYLGVPTGNFDPAAIYEVTYIVLDKYLFTTNPIDLSGSYNANLHEVVGKVVEKQVNLETKVSVIENTLVKKEPWFSPTLLSGWVNDSIYKTEYYRDNFGFVHLRGIIKDGILNETAFILPVGYRPPRAMDYIISCPVSGTTNTYGRLRIYASGAVTVLSISGSSKYACLDEISFKVD